MSKKNKRTIACILVIIGALAIISGLVLDNFILKDDTTKKDDASHQPEKVEICKSINYEEKSSFVISSYDLEVENKKPILLTSSSNFYSELQLFELPEDFEENINLDENDYLVYFMSDGTNCARSKYLTNYTLNNNKLTLEFTNSEFNTSECTFVMYYAYGIAFEKGTLNLENTTIDVTNVEDPFKDCYK